MGLWVDQNISQDSPTDNGLLGFFLGAPGTGRPFRESKTQEEGIESCNVKKVKLVNWFDFSHLDGFHEVSSMPSTPHPANNHLLIKRNFQVNGMVGSRRLRICSPPSIS